MTGRLRKGRASEWLRESRGGLLVLALGVGVGAGLGAVAFRFLIYFFTWLMTGHGQFGKQGHIGSAHLPWLGLGFYVLIPVVGGLAYGPLIYRYAREARGHGVPEVMLAVADSGGRIRPQVSLVKAVASALCIGSGGSVGREGPIAQIGSALASGLGQWARMPESRMRILVACGAGGGIAATFNAPVTGVFFGVELILRELSAEALSAVMVSAVAADVTGEAFLGSGRFLTGFPSGIVLHHFGDYLLVAVLAVIAALIGAGFKAVLYATDDLCDRAWKNRPEWARPAVGGVALGLLLLALPQMYGVGYPVLYRAVAGGYALSFLIVLALGKMVAASLTIGIGGSGGVFAPSLFVGATSGMAFGEIAVRLLGPAAGQPVMYAAVAMGAVFAAAARAPLTSLASVVEMTGDYALTLPVMLAVAVATVASRALSYGTIYTTRLLRRGTDVDRPVPAPRGLTVADAMHRLPVPLAVTRVSPPVTTGATADGQAALPAASPTGRTIQMMPHRPGSSASAVLEARGVHKSYGRHKVLRGVDLTVKPGQLVAVTGENGSGKSTLLKILAGTLAADHGDVWRAGTIGYCPQDPVLDESLTVDQHLRYFAAAYRLPALDRAGPLLDMLGFGQFRHHVAGTLSGGTRQKLNLTLALLHDPDVLLLDEPYQGFDWETYLRFWGVVDDLRSRGKAIVIITHLAFEQGRYDLLASLADGCVTSQVPSSEDSHAAS